MSNHAIVFYPPRSPCGGGTGVAGTGPQLATQSRDDREIVLDLSAHPKHDEALSLLRGRVTSAG